MTDALIARVGPEPSERNPIHTVATSTGAHTTLWPAVFLLILHPDGRMAYRYASDGKFAGDTWHESREAALQALDTSTDRSWESGSRSRRTRSRTTSR